jgi:hypothetical protein
MTCSIRATNEGPGEATDVRVLDAIPRRARGALHHDHAAQFVTGGAIACDIGTLPRNATAEVRVTADVAADRTGSTIVNGATVTAAEVDLDQADNFASASPPVLTPPVGSATDDTRERCAPCPLHGSDRHRNPGRRR